MTPRELRHAATRNTVDARIISDGCRDCIVEVVLQTGAGLLRHPRGNVLRFKSLGEARSMLARCGTKNVVLRQRVADDETGLATSHVGFHDLPVARSGGWVPDHRNI